MNVNDLQNKLMPFLIVAISCLAIIYLSFFFLETNEIQKAMSKQPAIQENVVLNTSTLNEKKWENLYTLEKFALSSRYYQATLIVRSRILIISLSFLTGITLSITGAIFILAKYSERGTEMGAGNGTWNLKLISSSPGIILSFFGIVFIAVSISSKTSFNVVDTPLYLIEPPVGTAFTTEDPRKVIGQATKKKYPVDSNKKRAIDSFFNN